MNLQPTIERSCGFNRRVHFRYAFEFHPSPQFFLTDCIITDELSGNKLATWNCKSGGTVDPSLYTGLIDKDDVKRMLYQFLDGIRVVQQGRADFTYNKDDGLADLLEELEEVPLPPIQPSHTAERAFESGDLSFSET